MVDADQIVHRHCAIAREAEANPRLARASPVIHTSSQLMANVQPVVRLCHHNYWQKIPVNGNNRKVLCGKVTHGKLSLNFHYSGLGRKIRG